MKNSKIVLGIAMLLIVVISLSFTNTTSETYIAADNSCDCTALYALDFNSTVPTDKYLFNQEFANCFAWKEFVALNWSADGSSSFGNPNDVNPVMWENYMEKEVLFPENGQAPPAWGSKHELLKKDAQHKRVLMHVSKFTSFNDTINISETGQAAPSKGPNWLGAFNGTNLWYEVLVNKDEYDYITDSIHKFYNADNQLKWVEAGNTIELPKGDAETNTVGAMELKAAWMEILPNSELDKTRYKISEAIVIDPTTGKSRDAQVALIGLHIIHKTKSQPTWVWATFEHVDNAPTAGTTPNGFYNLFKTDCTDTTMEIPAAFSANGKAEQVTISCDSLNVSPPYYLGVNGPKPVQQQVQKETPLGNVMKTNRVMQEAIKKYYPNSVFQHYQLVNVIWSTGPILDTEQNGQIPLRLKGMQPPSKLANASMETYAQDSRCTDCHQFGTIAGSQKYASDFSFVLSAASSPSN